MQVQQFAMGISAAFPFKAVPIVLGLQAAAERGALRWESPSCRKICAKKGMDGGCQLDAGHHVYLIVAGKQAVSKV